MLEAMHDCSHGEKTMKRAKSIKLAGAKATLDHVTGSTGRDGAFDFASKTEFMSRVSAQPRPTASRLDIAAFKKNAEQCARQAARATEAGIRSSYEKLARSWRQLAQHAEALTSTRER
jgi:hypothetical protein